VRAAFGVIQCEAFSLPLALRKAATQGGYMKAMISLTVMIFIAGIDPSQSPEMHAQSSVQQPTINGSCEGVIRYFDSTYGGEIARIARPDSHLHNIYYHRNTWNADLTYMIGIQANQEQKNWRVVLYDGNGCFRKELFGIQEYDWKLVWDRKNPDTLYTWRGSNLYRYNVITRKAQLLKSFALLGLRAKPSGLSLNQAGDRILVITSDGVFRSYRLLDMAEERAFKPGLPEGCRTDWEDERYIGYKNYIAAACTIRELNQKNTYIYDDTGHLFSHLNGIPLEHSDFSPDGRMAYGKMWGGRARGVRHPFEIHVVNLDGTDDRTLYSVPHHAAKYLQNFHISWPDRVTEWFIVSFFPSAQNLPTTYAPPLDEILLISTSGKYRFLARTHTEIATRRTGFWGQPLASPSADGSRISFNSNRSGGIDHHILRVPTPPFP
jgi:hypothetical protein